MTGPPNLKTGPRERVPSMHTFALRDPWMWERLRWLRKWVVEKWSTTYQPMLGPMTENEMFAFEMGGGRKHVETESEHRTEVNGLALAEAVSSEDVKTGKHHILIDIDRPCALIPSTSNGHFHLYVQMGTMGDGMDFDDYAEWLRASAKLGLIEDGYAQASIRRRATFIRLPWIRKGTEVEDRQRALGWWIEQPEEVGVNGRVPTPSTPPL